MINADLLETDMLLTLPRQWKWVAGGFLNLLDFFKDDNDCGMNKNYTDAGDKPGNKYGWINASWFDESQDEWINASWFVCKMQRSKPIVIWHR